MALATELAVEAIELEAFVEEIPDLQAHFDKLQTRLEKGGKKIQCSFSTNRGGVQRAPFWAGTRVQGGAGIHYFTRAGRSWDLGVNGVHISSASLGDRNPGVNASVEVQLGYTFWK